MIYSENFKKPLKCKYIYITYTHTHTCIYTCICYYETIKIDDSAHVREVRDKEII